MSSRPIRRASALAALVGVLSTPAFAQSGTSTISGVVRDSTDAPLPGAVVKVINEDTGGVVVMSTRSGTSDFRATLFESLRHDALDARNVFARTKPPIRLNQFGGTAGGPLKPGRTFFFGSWERTRQLTSDAVVSTVPTLQNRQGNFADLRDAAGWTVTIFQHPRVHSGGARLWRHFECAPRADRAARRPPEPVVVKGRALSNTEAENTSAPLRAKRRWLTGRCTWS